MTRDGRDGRRKLRGENCVRLMARFQSIVYIVTGGRYGGRVCFDKYLRLWFIKVNSVNLLPIFFFFMSGIDWQSSVLRYFQIALKFACKYVTWWKLICTDDKEI